MTILNQIYEVDFQGFSYGFRPGRGPHQALDALSVGIESKRVSWVLDCDVQKCFDTLSHDWLDKFIKHRVADPRMLRLIRKWLKAGVSEDGQWSETKVGTPQGLVASPLLANVYLHYVFDLWVEAWRKKVAKGDVIVVRYADDFVVGFQHRSEAERFWRELQERFAKGGLELHAGKTRLIEFGRFAAQNRKRRGEGKPETFDFLGFTHYCGKRRKTGTYTVWRKTVKKRMVAKLHQLKAELRRRMHDPTALVGAWLKQVVQGFYQYHAVPGNSDRLALFQHRLRLLWRHVLFRRSQKGRKSWKRLNRPLGSSPSRSASLSNGPLLRYSSEVGAVCVSSASTDLCGGRRVTGVPTAIPSRSRLCSPPSIAPWVGALLTSRRTRRRGRLSPPCRSADRSRFRGCRPP